MGLELRSSYRWGALRALRYGSALQERDLNDSLGRLPGCGGPVHSGDFLDFGVKFFPIATVGIRKALKAVGQMRDGRVVDPSRRGQVGPAFF